MDEKLLKQLKEKSVLFVDDEPTTRRAMERMLKKYFGDVLLAENGQQGLETCQQNCPHLIITDIEMPVMNGLEMLQQIKSKKPHDPVIIMTAYEDLAHEASEADAVIIKPLDKKILFEQLARLFS